MVAFVKSRFAAYPLWGVKELVINEAINQPVSSTARRRRVIDAKS